MIKTIIQFVWNMFWVSVSLTVLFINLMLFTDAAMALTGPLWVPIRARIIATDELVSQARYRPYLDITYEYYANGQRYTSKKICFLELPFGCARDQLDELAKYEVGDFLSAHSSPFLPQAAVIVHRTEASRWVAFIISLPITLLGSWIAFLPGWQIIKRKYHGNSNHLSSASSSQ
ncbi:MAG: hypothetical protein KJZ72_15230 [Anaerolineales bacterium]|jgi:hypothetical protein|nr:hypothetical protein [Anaerolineales bacterium]